MSETPRAVGEGREGGGDQAAAEARWSLAADPEYLARSLPAPDEGRYARFTELGKVFVGKGYLYDARFLAGESRLLVTSAEERSFRLYEVASKKLLGRFEVPGAQDFSAALEPWPGDDTTVLTASPLGLYRVSVETGQVLAHLSEEPTDRAAWSPDGHYLITTSSKIPEQVSTLVFYRREGAELHRLGSLDSSERVDGLALSPDNQLLATTLYPSGRLRVANLAEGEELFTLEAPKYASSVAFSPNGRYVAVAGQGLLLVDLLHPGRRAYYGFVYNNMGAVRFSPSGDAVLASSYDGRVRVFGIAEVRREGEARTRLELKLLRELRHQGVANVYGFDISADGERVVSASGDQTVRIFGRRVSAAAQAKPAAFRSLAEWKRDDELKSQDFALRPLPVEPFRYQSISAVRPTKLRPGRYGCKITAIYKLRECIVFQNEAGQTVLSFGEGALLPLEGLVFDEAGVIRFLGSLRERSELYDCTGCDRQPILGFLRGGPARYEGLIQLTHYYDPLAPPEPLRPDTRLEEAMDRWPVVLEYRGPLEGIAVTSNH